MPLSSCDVKAFETTPQRARHEVLVLRIEVQLMHIPVEMARNVQFRFHERPVYEELRGNVRDLTAVSSDHIAPRKKMRITEQQAASTATTPQRSRGLQRFSRSPRNRVHLPSESASSR
jgi:hypothetical protein